jgi:hypothetical protein
VRKLIAPIILMSLLGFAGPSLARDIALHKHAADEIKTVCAKAGGSFSQGAGVYACGTNCHGGPGTDCIVSCTADQTCTAQVIGGRRPTTPLSALQAPARAAR